MDPEFFENLAMPLFDQLFNLAHWLTGDRTDAEDLVQEACLRAWRGFAGFRGGDGRSWLLTIVFYIKFYISSQRNRHSNECQYCNKQQQKIGSCKHIFKGTRPIVVIGMPVKQLKYS